MPAFCSASAQKSPNEPPSEKNRTQDVKDQQLRVERYDSTSHGTEVAPEQDSERCAASRHKAILDARLRRNTAYLEICWQRVCLRKTCMLQSRRRVVVVSTDR